MIVQAHRGAGRAYPENTLESFEIAWQMGAVPEADVRMTADGVITAFHDATLDRTLANPPEELRGRRMGEVNWSELCHLDAGVLHGEQFSGQRVPEMRRVFEAMRGRPARQIYLDIKEIDLPGLTALARESGVARQCIAASTHHSTLRQWRSLLPAAQTLLWMGGSQERFEERLAELRSVAFDGITQLQSHVRQSAEGYIEPSEQFLRDLGVELRERGILFQALPLWPAGVGDYLRLMALGVESFATDDPEVALEAAARAGC